MEYDYKNFYNSQAKDYEKFQTESKSVIYLYLPFVKKTLGDLKDLEILDIGCGSGIQLFYLSSQMPKRLVGIDLSEEQLEITRKRLEGKCELYLVDVCNENTRFSNLQKNSFDVIYSSLVTSSIPDKDNLKKFLQFSYDALKNGGYYYNFFNDTNKIFEFGVKEDIMTFIIEKKKKESLKNGDEYYVIYQDKENPLICIYWDKTYFIELMSSVGFVDIEIKDDIEEEEISKGMPKEQVEKIMKAKYFYAFKGKKK